MLLTCIAIIWLILSLITTRIAVQAALQGAHAMPANHVSDLLVILKYIFELLFVVLLFQIEWYYCFIPFLVQWLIIGPIFRGIYNV